MQQAYDRPTTWLRTIYTRTTFSPTTCQNRVQFHSGGLGIATNKMAESGKVSAAVIVSIICKRRKKKRKVKEVWEREWLRRRTERGVFRQLLEELRLEDECNYRRYLRMDTETFQVRLNGFPYFVNTYSGCFGAFLNCERHFQIMVFMDIRNFSV